LSPIAVYFDFKKVKNNFQISILLKQGW